MTPDHPVDSPQGQPDPRTDPSYGAGPASHAWAEVLAVKAGDVVLFSSSWSGLLVYKVSLVRPPATAVDRGVVWEGCYWRWHDVDEPPHWSGPRVRYLWPDNFNKFQGLAGPGDYWTFGVPD